LSFTFATFETTTISATVVNYQAATNLINNFQIYDNLGSELINQTGDIALKTLSALPFNNLAGVKNWLEVQFNGTTVNVYYMGSVDDSDNSFSELDQKRGLYSIRIPSIQAVFHRDLGEHQFIFSSDTDDWNGDLNSNAEVEFDITQEGPSLIFNQVGFTVADAIKGLSQKVSGKGYKIVNVSTSLPGKEVTGLTEACILFAGIGVDVGQTDIAKVNLQFQNPRIFWRKIFEIAAASENAFISAKGVIIANELTLDVDTRQKTVEAFGPTAVTWLERTLLKNRFSVPGVKITGPHDDIIGESYTLGDPETIGALNINLETVGNVIPDGAPDNTALRFLAGGVIDSPPTNRFDIIDVSNKNKLYFQSTNIDPNYQGMIGVGDMYRGQTLYNGEVVGNRVVVDSISLQLIRQTIRQNGISNVEFNVVS